MPSTGTIWRLVTSIFQSTSQSSRDWESKNEESEQDVPADRHEP